MQEQEITLKNTKAEILAALNEALKRAEVLEKGKLNPEKIERDKHEKEVIKSAKASVEQNIFSKELNDKFKDLETAITAEETRLQELYGISKELLNLTLIIEAGAARQAEISAEYTKLTAESKESLEQMKAEHARKKAELTEEYEAYTKKLKIERTRENEEYQYNLKRIKEKENNLWNDEKVTRELALAKKEEETQALLSEAQSKIDYIKTLEDKAESIPALLESEKEKVTDQVTKTLNREYEFKTTLAEKDHEADINRLNDKIFYLEKELESTNKLNTSLQSRLDKAYGEIKELATKTVESAGGVKIIGGAESK